MDGQNEKLLADAIRNPLKYGITGCILCNGRFRMTAVFTPTESFGKLIGQPKGKQRLIVYGLCEQCNELPDSVDRIEQAILSRMGVQ